MKMKIISPIILGISYHVLHHNFLFTILFLTIRIAFFQIIPGGKLKNNFGVIYESHLKLRHRWLLDYFFAGNWITNCNNWNILGRFNFRGLAIFFIIEYWFELVNDLLDLALKTKILNKTYIEDFFCSGGRTWTYNLRVMSPTSYQLLHPAM